MSHRRSCGVQACLRWAAVKLDYCEVHADQQPAPPTVSQQQRAGTRRAEEAASRDSSRVLVFTIREAVAMRDVLLATMGPAKELAALDTDLGRAWRVLALQLSVLPS